MQIPVELQNYTQVSDVVNYFRRSVVAAAIGSKLRKSDYEPILERLDQLLSRPMEDTAACSESLIHLQTIAQDLLKLSNKLSQPKFAEIADLLVLKIEHLMQSDPRYQDYYSVQYIPEFSTTSRIARLALTGLPNLHAATLVNAIAGNALTKKVAPFLADDATRAEARKFNGEFTRAAIDDAGKLYSAEQWQRYQATPGLVGSFDNVPKYPASLQRYRVDTEHGQSLNVFESCVRKSDAASAPDHNTLYIIALHGQGSYASKQHILRVAEARQLLQREAGMQNVVVVTPDYAGSVASGGTCRSMNELAQNTVVNTVEHLVARGVDPAQIVVRGFSLGGMVATVGVAKCCSKGMNVSLINVDSFANAGKWLGAKEDLAATPLLGQWDTKADVHFNKIPKDRAFCIAKTGDAMMWQTAAHQNRSLYHVLAKSNPDVESSTQLRLITINGFDHNDDVILMGDANPCLDIYKGVQRRLQASPQNLGTAMDNNERSDSSNSAPNGHKPAK